MTLKSIKRYALLSTAVLTLAAGPLSKAYANENTFDFTIHNTDASETSNKREIVTIFFVNAKGELLKTETESAKRVLMTTNVDKNPITADTLNAAVRTFSFDASLSQVGDLQVEDNITDENGVNTHRVTKYIVIDSERLDKEQTSVLLKQMDELNLKSDVVTGDTNNAVTLSTETTNDKPTIETSNKAPEVNRNYQKTINYLFVIDHNTGEFVKNKDGEVMHVLGDVRFVQPSVERYYKEFAESGIVKQGFELSNRFTSFVKDVDTNDGLKQKIQAYVAVIIPTGSQLPTELTTKYNEKAKELSETLAKTAKGHSELELLSGEIKYDGLTAQTDSKPADTTKPAEEKKDETKPAEDKKEETKPADTTKPAEEKKEDAKSEQDKKLLEDKKKLTEEKPKTQFAKTNVKNYTAIFTALLAIAGGVALAIFNKKKTEK